MAAKTIKNKKARAIKSGKKIIASQRDSEIFLINVLNVDKPNNELISAVKLYEKVITELGLR